MYFISDKCESFKKFKEFKNEAEEQLGKSIKALRSVQGGECLSTNFKLFLKEHGIIFQLTPLGTLWLNGASKRRNCIILDMVQSIMSYTNFPIIYGIMHYKLLAI